MLAQCPALVLGGYGLWSAPALAERLDLAAGRARFAGLWRAEGLARRLGFGIGVAVLAAMSSPAPPSLSECQSGACPWSHWVCKTTLHQVDS